MLIDPGDRVARQQEFSVAVEMKKTVHHLVGREQIQELVGNHVQPC